MDQFAYGTNFCNQYNLLVGSGLAKATDCSEALVTIYVLSVINFTETLTKIASVVDLILKH